jgi:hypothetical protein
MAEPSYERADSDDTASPYRGAAASASANVTKSSPWHHSKKAHTFTSPLYDISALEKSGLSL